MPKESEVREGFSPSQYLLDVLITSAKSSVKTGQWLDCTLCQTCTKDRQKVNVCVAENGQAVLLSVCNSQESKARNAILTPLPGQNTATLQKELLRFVRQTRLGAKLDNSVSGQCLENLNAVLMIPSSSCSPQFSVQGGRAEMSNIAGDRNNCLKVASLLATKVASKVMGIKEVKLTGTTILCARAQALEEDQSCLMIRDGKVAWHFCQHKHFTTQMFELTPENGHTAATLTEDLLAYLPEICGSNCVHTVKEMECLTERDAAREARQKPSAPGDAIKSSIYSRRFPEVITLPKEAEEVYLTLLSLRHDHGGKMEEDGTFILEKAVQLLDGVASSLGKAPLWWQAGWNMLLDISPKIVEHPHKGSGMLIHHIRLDSDLTAHCLHNSTDAKKMKDLPGLEALTGRKAAVATRRHLGPSSGMTAACLERIGVRDETTKEEAVSKQAREQGEVGAFSSRFPHGLTKALDHEEALAYQGLLELARKTQDGKIYATNELRGCLTGLKAWAKSKKLSVSGATKGFSKLRARKIVVQSNPHDTKPKCFVLHHVQLPENGQDIPSDKVPTAVRVKESRPVATPGSGGSVPDDAFGQLFGQTIKQLQSIREALTLTGTEGFEFRDNNDGTQTISFTIKK